MPLTLTFFFLAFLSGYKREFKIVKPIRKCLEIALGITLGFFPPIFRSRTAFF